MSHFFLNFKKGKNKFLQLFIFAQIIYKLSDDWERSIALRVVLVVWISLLVNKVFSNRKVLKKIFKEYRYLKAFFSYHLEKKKTFFNVTFTEIHERWSVVKFVSFIW